MGTKITGLNVVKVVDGDTLHVNLSGKVERIRLTNVDTEESLPGGDKPVTDIGIRTSQMAKEYFHVVQGGDDVVVDIEFDTDDPAEDCLKIHRDNFGRILCYIFKNNENYNLKLIKEGWSPYFEKYGRARVYDTESTNAERLAQSKNLLIWNNTENESGHTRGNYSELKNWWNTRALIVEDYRNHGNGAGVLSVRLDYEKIVAAAEREDQVSILCDLQGGINKWTDDAALIFAGSQFHKFNLWIPDRTQESAIEIINLITKRYLEKGTGYAYVKGKVTKFNNVPQIVLTSISQLSDFPI
jgi:endonuclease YncB( thermonuclease family)